MQARILGPFQLEEGRQIPVGGLVGGEVTYQPALTGDLADSQALAERVSDVTEPV